MCLWRIHTILNIWIHLLSACSLVHVKCEIFCCWYWVSKTETSLNWIQDESFLCGINQYKPLCTISSNFWLCCQATWWPCWWRRTLCLKRPRSSTSQRRSWPSTPSTSWASSTETSNQTTCCWTPGWGRYTETSRLTLNPTVWRVIAWLLIKCLCAHRDMWNCQILACAQDWRRLIARNFTGTWRTIRLVISVS